MKRLLGIIIFTCVTTSAYPWGIVAHKTICHLAEKFLEQETKSDIAKILFEGESFPEICAWADVVARDDDHWDYIKDWHFISIPDNYITNSEDFIFDNTLSDPGSNGNVLKSILIFEDVLRDPTVSEKNKNYALKAYTHFVGDIHQPLHVGKSEDLGGNKVYLKWFINEQELKPLEESKYEKPWKLHFFWDTAMFYHWAMTDFNITFQEAMKKNPDLDYAQWSNAISTEFAQEMATSTELWNQSTVLDWMQESLDLRQEAYSIVSDEKFDDEDYKRLMPIAKRRVLQAATRLAYSLDRIFTHNKNSKQTSKEIRLRKKIFSQDYKSKDYLKTAVFPE